MKKTCPEHFGTGLTPTDTECHSHESNLQQRAHNIHCNMLNCPYALRGKQRYHDVPIKGPRNRLERWLKVIS